MIIESKKNLQLASSEKEETFPILPLRSGILFPQMTLTIQVARPENLALISQVQSGKKKFVSVYSPIESSDIELSKIPLHPVGVITQIGDVRPGPKDYKTVLLEGSERVALSRIVGTEPFITAVVNRIRPDQHTSAAIKEKAEQALSTVSQITNLDPSYSSEQLILLKASLNDPGLMADMITSSFRLPLSAKQEILETVDTEQRLELLLWLLDEELARIKTKQSIEENVKRTVRRKQEQEILKEELQEIKKRLGEEDLTEERESERIKQLIRDMPELPPEVVSRATIEADRLSQLSSASAEYGGTKNYLDWILSLPWGKCAPEIYDIKDVEKIIQAQYYGPNSIKQQILERLSVRKLLGGQSEGPTLCLVGAHGTGKASLAKAVAVAMGKEFIRVSVGGISEPSDIKGSPRTYVGAMPGKIIRTLRDSGTCNPLILIEDIDYFNIDNDSSVNMALLDAIDTRRNSRFLDQYLGVPFDLSKTYFICSVRSFEEIPEQFIPRLELLEIPGYIEKEKITISKRYIIPKLLSKHGINKSELKFNDKILAKIIRDYTMEAGLLGFSQQIENTCRKFALKKLGMKNACLTITERNLETYLGSAQYIPEKAVLAPEIGTATGLAWTGAGGELMFIEGLKMKGGGDIITTGSLGEVMRESIQAAHSYVRSKADVLAIDYNDFNEFDVHIHFPSGAIPKDGPSAGIAVCLVIASVMSERPIRNDIAMTGEVTLRGKVLPVGGIKEKISAAYRAGIYNIALPKENEKDLKELPKEIIRKTKFTYIERVDQLFETCLLDFTPSSFTLEKIFTQEIEKAKRRRRGVKGRRRAARSSSK